MAENGNMETRRKFYVTLIEPEIEKIIKKQEEHEGKFMQILGHFDDIID